MAVVIRHSGEVTPDSPQGAGAAAAERSLLNRFKFLLPVPPVTLTDKILFSDNLATILDAGLSIYDSLDILEEESKNRRMREILHNLKERVRAGQPFWVGLSSYADVFPPLFIGLVKVGESSGKLVEVLQKLSEKLRKEYELRGRIAAAATYPVVVLLAMVLVGVLMMLFVIPKLAGVFSESGLDLPLQTRALIAASDFMVADWPSVLVALAAAVIAVVLVRRIPRARAVADRAALRFPVIGPVVAQSELVWFAANLRVLLSSGFPVVESFDLLSQTAMNAAFRDGIAAAGTRVARGVPIAEALRADGALFPSLFHRMIRVGESTGRLDETLVKLTRHYESKLDNLLSNVAVLLNPLLTLLIGAFVAVMALAIIMPVYQLIGTFS